MNCRMAIGGGAWNSCWTAIPAVKYRNAAGRSRPKKTHAETPSETRDHDRLCMGWRGVKIVNR
jgi:hypothetical protein